VEEHHPGMLDLQDAEVLIWLRIIRVQDQVEHQEVQGLVEYRDHQELTGC
jgi:hypothetical protein